MEILITLSSAIFSGVVATVINIIYSHNRDKRDSQNRAAKEKRDYKMKILSDSLGYRGQITATNASHGKELEVAINQVFLAYQDSEDVLNKFMTFKENVHQHNDRVIDSLISLYKAMCNDLEINYSFDNDELFTQPLILG